MKLPSLTRTLFGAFLALSPVFSVFAGDDHGYASFYRPNFRGTTASGEIYDARLLTAAHPELPFGTLVRVTHLKSGNSVVVRINDRNPFNSGHVIDVSYAAAQRLGIASMSIAEVSVTALNPNQLQAQKSVPLPETVRQRESGKTEVWRKLVPVTSRSANPNSNVWQNQQNQAPRAKTQELAPAQDGASVNRPILRVQFGAFRDSSRAEAVRQELRQMNIDTMIVQSHRPGTLPLRVITSGVFFDEADARRWLDYVKHQTGRYSDAYVTR